MGTTQILLSGLVRDEKLRFRETYNSSLAETVERYAEAMTDYGKKWGEFPPLVAVRLTEAHWWHEELPDPDGGRFGKLKRVPKSYQPGTIVLVEGFTRSAAADVAGVKAAPAIIHSGTWADAERLAWAANSRHGRPRSREEVARVLESILARPEYRNAPGSELAKLAGTSRATANRYKKRRAASAIDAPPGPAVGTPSATADDAGEEAPVVVVAPAPDADANGRANAGTVPPAEVGGGVPARPPFADLPAARVLVERLKGDGAKLAALVAGEGGTIAAAAADVVRAAGRVEALLLGVAGGDCEDRGQP